MKSFIVMGLITISTASAHAETWNYICKDHGKLLPLKIEDKQSFLEWKGVTYKIKELDDCGFQGWRAEKDGTSFDFCMSNRGGVDFQLNGADVKCNLK